MQNNFKKFKKLPFFISILLLSFAIFAFTFVYKMTGKNISEAAEIEMQAREDERRYAELQFLELALNTFSPEISRLNSHFVRGNDVVPFLNLVEGLGPLVGAESEVTLVDISKDGASLNVGVSALGSFEALYKFLKLLENSPYELEFTSMEFRQSGGGELGAEEVPQATTWTIDLKIKVISFIP